MLLRICSLRSRGLSKSSPLLHEKEDRKTERERRVEHELVVKGVFAGRSSL